MIKVKYYDINQVARTEEGASILSVSLDNQITHLHECGGNGRCTTCRVRVIDGLQNLSPRNKIETELARKRNWSPDIRLACQSQVMGNIEVERLIWTSPEINSTQLETLPDGSGEERPVAILCCDIRGFTKITTDLFMSYDTAHLLNRFYTVLGDPILMNNGIIYQYVGDEIVGVFGVAGGNPEEHCQNAIRAALGMQFAARRLNQYELKDFNVQVKIGIGITHGLAFLGHLGHPKHRQFAVIGNPMNTASRIQEQTKHTKTNILVSEKVIGNLPEGLLDIGSTFYAELPGEAGKSSLYEVLGFSKMDLHLELQSSFDLLLQNEEGFVMKFYEELFNRLPEAKPLFKKSLRNQGRLLMHMMSSIVHSLGRPVHLKMGLRSLGRNHIKYGVKEEYYPVLVEVMLDAIEKELAGQLTEHTMDAWKTALELVTSVMQEAYGRSEL